MALSEGLFFLRKLFFFRFGYFLMIRRLPSNHFLFLLLNSD